MKREFLVGLGIDTGVIDQIMTENGKDIEGLKATVGVHKNLVTELTTKLQNAESKVTELSKVDISALTNERDSYKTQYEQALKDKDTAVAKVQYDSVLDNSLNGYKFTSSFARDGIRSKLSEAGLKIKDGKLDGFEDSMKKLMEENKDAFVIEDNKPKPQFTSSVQNASSNMSESEYLDKQYANNPYYKK